LYENKNSLKVHKAWNPLLIKFRDIINIDIRKNDLIALEWF